MKKLWNPSIPFWIPLPKIKLFSTQFHFGQRTWFSRYYCNWTVAKNSTQMKNDEPLIPTRDTEKNNERLMKNNHQQNSSQTYAAVVRKIKFKWVSRDLSLSGIGFLFLLHSAYSIIELFITLITIFRSFTDFSVPRTWIQLWFERGVQVRFDRGKTFKFLF